MYIEIEYLLMKIKYILLKFASGSLVIIYLPIALINVIYSPQLANLETCISFSNATIASIFQVSLEYAHFNWELIFMEFKNN